MRSPLLGFNHNLKYRGRVYHVQTEDSGEANPHIFTHLFHNGIILSTRKTEYAHLLGTEDVEDQVRKLMQLQHKDMMKGLLAGQFDDKIVRYFGVLVAPEADVEAPKAESTPMPPAPPTHMARKPDKAGTAKPIPSGAVFAQEDTKLGLGQSPQPPPAAAAPKTSTTTLREQSVSALGPAQEAPGGLPRTRPATTADPARSEPAPSVVIARPAIILTGDEPSFGSFSSPGATRPAAKKPNRQVELFEATDTQLDLAPVGSRPAEEAPVVRNPRPSQPGPNRLTGPIEAPPGLFKPESSTELPEELMHLSSADTKVDDIILDFLMAESLSKLPHEDDPKP
jgi:hypothetical protein